MAVKGNIGDGSADSKVVTKSFKTIYGIAPFKVVAINPTMEQLISLGINAQKEPEYQGEKSRVDVWMESVLPVKKTEGSVDKSLEELGIEKQLIQKASIFISNTTKGKADGSTAVWINNFGNISGAPTGTQPTASWWKPEGQHIAREGEIELIKLIRAWVNAGPTDEVNIENWEALIRGDVKELRQILVDFKNNIVRSMIEIRVSKEGKPFAGINVDHHEPWNIYGLSGWTKAFKQLKERQFISYSLKEYIASDPTPTADAPASTTGDQTVWT